MQIQRVTQNKHIAWWIIIRGSPCNHQTPRVKNRTLPATSGAFPFVPSQSQPLPSKVASILIFVEIIFLHLYGRIMQVCILWHCILILHNLSFYFNVFNLRFSILKSFQTYKIVTKIEKFLNTLYHDSTNVNILHSYHTIIKIRKLPLI